MGAVIGSIEYPEDHVTQKVNTWSDELNTLCDIARIEPQAAYRYFVSGYNHTLTYIMRTISNIFHQLEKIDDLMLTKFVPAITGGMSTQSNVTFSHYLQNMVVWVSQYFQSLQILNFKTHKSCQKIYETKLLSKNEQAVNSTTRRIRIILHNFAKTLKWYAWWTATVNRNKPTAGCIHLAHHSSHKRGRLHHQQELFLGPTTMTMGGNYSDSQQPVNVGPVWTLTTLFRARKEAL